MAKEVFNPQQFFPDQFFPDQFFPVGEPTTAVPPTAAPTTLPVTTLSPSTLSPTTIAPGTVAPTTLAPSTAAPATTLAPSTAAPTTSPPTTAAPSTPPPGTVASLIASTYKQVSWLFDVTTTAPTTTYWSFKDKSWGGNNYTFKIIPKSFSGITLSRSRSEMNMVAPSEVTFEVSNKDNTLTASDYENAEVIIRVIISDGTDEEQCRIWKFIVKTCEPVYQKLKFTCQDFVSPYLDGDYPTGKIVKEIFPSKDPDLDINDNLCVPVTFGWAYLPLRPVYISADSKSYYLISPGSHSITIQKVRAPRSKGNSEYETGYTFTQVTRADGDAVMWRMFSPIIVDSDNDGTVDAAGFWKDGTRVLDMPTYYRRTDGDHPLDNPADVVEFVLEDMGVDSGDLDTGVDSSFADAESDYFNNWALTFNGGFYYKTSRAKALSMLLNQCYGSLRVGEKVELHILKGVKAANSSQTLTRADIMEDTFKYSTTAHDKSDSGYVAFQLDGEPQDVLVKALVSASGTTDQISNDIVEMPFIKNTQYAQKLSCMYFQRKLLKEATLSFRSKGTVLARNPDEILTINHADYGGNYVVLIDSMTIRRDLSIDFKCIKYSQDLDDWADLAYPAITYNTDDYTSSYSYTPVIAGPDSGTPTSGNLDNVLPGRLRVGSTGSYIIIDPVNKSVESSDYVTGDAGVGFHLSGSLLETSNVACRGILRTAVFQKDVISAVGGNVLIRPSDVLAGTELAFGGTNLVVNGDMELDSNWASVGTPVSNIRSSTNPHDGTYCRRIVVDAANEGIQSDAFTTITNRCYHLEFWVYTYNRTMINVNIRKGDNSDWAVGQTAVVAVNTWVRVTYEWQEDAGGAGAYLQVLSNFASGTFLVDDVIIAQSNLTIEGNETFSDGDILRIKDSSDDEWFEVTRSVGAPTYNVLRDKEGNYGGSGALAHPRWKEGATVVSYGQAGDGGIMLTSSETNAPYLSIFTTAGSPWSDLSTKLKLGNLNGFAGYGSDIYGLAFYNSATNYLKIDPTNGIQIQIDSTKANAITVAGGGDIKFVKSDANPGLLNWDSTYYMGANATATSGLCIYAASDGVGYLRIGYSDTSTVAAFQQIFIRAEDFITIWANEDPGSGDAYIHVAANSTDGYYIALQATDNAGIKSPTMVLAADRAGSYVDKAVHFFEVDYMIFDEDLVAIYAGNSTCSLGRATDPWGPIYANLKSGTTPDGAGAQQYELWIDTDDDYTVKARPDTLTTAAPTTAPP